MRAGWRRARRPQTSCVVARSAATECVASATRTRHKAFIPYDVTGPVKRHRGEPGHTTVLKSQGQDTRANRTQHTTSSSTQPHAKQQSAGFFAGQVGSVFSHLASRNILSRTPTRQIEQPRTISQSVSQLFHGPAPRSPLHRTIERIGREGHGTFLKTAVYIGVHRTCFAVSRVFGYYAARSRSFFFSIDFWGAALVSSLTTLNTRYFSVAIRRAAGGGGTPRTAGRCLEPVPGVGLSPPRRAPGRVYADLVRQG